MMSDKHSLTGQYLTGELGIAVPERRAPDWRRSLKVINARGQQPEECHRRNSARAVHLRHRRFRRRQIDAADRNALQGGRAQAEQCAASARRRTTRSRAWNLDKVIDIDQSPIGRTPRSNPATYTGAFTPIREWFAGLPEAKARGYEPGRFSFNVKGGRCEACQGDGVIKIEMHFLPDVYVTATSARASATTAKRWKSSSSGKSIADVLDMTVEEARGFLQGRAAHRARSWRRCSAWASATSRSASRRRRCRAAKRSA